MMHPHRLREGASRRRRREGGRALVFIFYCAVFSGSALARGPDYAAWIDSLVAAGNRSLDSHDQVSARRYFTAAYKCGMSKDSMYYFAAEIYLRAFAADTAMTFNWALEKSGHFKREIYLEQRARIFRAIGWKREADSLLAFIRKKEQHDVGLFASASRSILSLSPFSLAPINLTLRMPDADIDDNGNGGLRYKWSRHQDTRLKRIFMLLDGNTDIRLPTRHSFDEASDTLIRSISLYAGAGDFPSTPEGMLGHRIAVHKDKKIDHFDKASCSFSIGKQRFLQAGQDIKWTIDQGIDESRTRISLSQLSFQRKYTFLLAVSLSHQFSNMDLYQNKSGSGGIYQLIPVGYVDSLDVHDTTEPEYRYYRDQGLKDRYTGTQMRMDTYWARQPGMRLVTFPKHNLAAELKSSLQFKLPFRLNLTLLNSIQCLWYPKKIEWFTADDTISYSKLYTDCDVIFNAADGNYYINKNPNSPYYMKNNLVELKKHGKKRIDCYISLSTALEKQVCELGKFYFSATYLKNFSTLRHDDPIVGLNYCWELQAGWKKDISFTR